MNWQRIQAMQYTRYVWGTLDVRALRVPGPFLNITRIRLESGDWWLVSGLCDVITVMYTCNLVSSYWENGCLGIKTVVLL